MNENKRNQLRTIRTTKLLSQDFIPTQNHVKKLSTHPLSNKFLMWKFGPHMESKQHSSNNAENKTIF